MKTLDKKHNQIIDEAYRNYGFTCIRETKQREQEMKEKGGWLTLCLTPYFEDKEKFIELIKTDSKFSDKWGLKIEERNLNKNQGWERYELLLKRTSEKELQEKYKDDEKAAWLGFRKFTLENANYICDKENVPTKLITITYNNEIIESYE